MANYVHNYLLCDNVAKEKIMNLDDNDLIQLNGYYDDNVLPMGEGQYLIIFDTRGMEYRQEFIKRFIREYRNTKWYCIEENEIEQGFFFWNGTDVECRKRRMGDALHRSKQIEIRYEDVNFYPLYKIFMSDTQIAFDNILANEVTTYAFCRETTNRINEYIDSLLKITSGDYTELAIPIEEGINRTVYVNWNNISYVMHPYSEEDDWQQKVQNGETEYCALISFLNSIVRAEGIDEIVSFNWETATRIYETVASGS